MRTQHMTEELKRRIEQQVRKKASRTTNYSPKLVKFCCLVFLVLGKAADFITLAYIFPARWRMLGDFEKQFEILILATLNLKRALSTVMMFSPLLLFKFLFWRDVKCHVTQLPRTTNCVTSVKTRGVRTDSKSLVGQLQQTGQFQLGGSPPNSNCWRQFAQI